ncbi:MAG: hypothetical protein K0V04_05660 [Deltaproteobacteria bacterium]|nr:hypothetical protein [Deltaproteobacteria bacterium]
MRWPIVRAVWLGLLGGCGGSSDPQPEQASTSTTSPSATASTAVVDESGTGSTAMPCNGHVELCDRPFDEVVFAGTHNSHSALDEGFPVLNANQEHGISRQLSDGIRVMLIDVYPDADDPDTVVMCHGPCGLASTPHVDGLTEIVEFLQDNPREVVTIIYEDHVAVDQIAADFATTGADALTFAHPSGDPWPSLGAMIDANTRLVVTGESGGPPPAWFHHVWDEAWDTPYGPMQAEDLSCDLNRGSSDHALFLMNHWVNDELGLPSMDNAAAVNVAAVLQARADDCAAQWTHVPNFVVVDFYEQGDLFAVVDALNGV